MSSLIFLSSNAYATKAQNRDEYLKEIQPNIKKLIPTYCKKVTDGKDCYKNIPNKQCIKSLQHTFNNCQNKLMPELPYENVNNSKDSWVRKLVDCSYGLFYGEYQNKYVSGKYMKETNKYCDTRPWKKLLNHYTSSYGLKIRSDKKENRNNLAKGEDVCIDKLNKKWADENEAKTDYQNDGYIPKGFKRLVRRTKGCQKSIEEYAKIVFGSSSKDKKQADPASEVANAEQNRNNLAKGDKGDINCISFLISNNFMEKYFKTIRKTFNCNLPIIKYQQMIVDYGNNNNWGELDSDKSFRSRDKVGGIGKNSLFFHYKRFIAFAHRYGETDLVKAVEKERIERDKLAAERLELAKSKGFNTYKEYRNDKLAKSKGYNSYEEYRKAENKKIRKQKQERAAARALSCPNERKVDRYCEKMCRGRDNGATGAKSASCKGKCLRNNGC